MEANLHLYLHILRQRGISPTFPVTAKILSRHPDLIKKFSDAGAEFAVHGYKHIDYTKSSADVLFQHLQKATKIFERHNIAFLGFRFPYLRWDKEHLDIIRNYPFKWDSSLCILWDVFKNMPFEKRKWITYQSVLSQYDYRDSRSYVSLPRFLNNSEVLEIPVSLPDDDLLFDRLNIKNEKILGQIWGDILRQTYLRGEIFTLQLHPERISMFKKALESVVQTAKQLNPKVWISSLDAIYKWWNERSEFGVILKSKGNGYEVEVNCTRRATLLLKTFHLRKNRVYDSYSVIKEHKFRIRGNKRPVLGIPKESSPKMLHFLKNEGFVFETTEQKEDYALHLDNAKNFSEKDEMKTLGLIHTCNLPLIRFWRWPNRCRSALSVTGDIDALTSIDFFPRFIGR